MENGVVNIARALAQRGITNHVACLERAAATFADRLPTIQRGLSPRQKDRLFPGSRLAVGSASLAVSGRPSSTVTISAPSSIAGWPPWAAGAACSSMASTVNSPTTNASRGACASAGFSTAAAASSTLFPRPCARDADPSRLPGQKNHRHRQRRGPHAFYAGGSPRRPHRPVAASRCPRRRRRHADSDRSSATSS